MYRESKHFVILIICFAQLTLFHISSCCLDQPILSRLHALPLQHCSLQLRRLLNYYGWDVQNIHIFEAYP